MGISYLILIILVITWIKDGEHILAKAAELKVITTDQYKMITGKDYPTQRPAA